MVLRRLYERHKGGILGVLQYGDAYYCWTLEPNRRANQRNRSCIPPGHYDVHVYRSRKYRCECIRVLDVPGRSGILIHPGNTVADTRGCILVGPAVSCADGRYRLAVSSRDTLAQVVRTVRLGDRVLRIYNSII